MITRRSFIQMLSVLAGSTLPGKAFPALRPARKVMTVRGLIESGELGNTLIHEHILVDFSGAATYDPTRWNDDDVITKVLPYLIEIKNDGCNSLIDCTPNYLGRDVLLLKKLSELSGLHIVTNTGYYGGSDHKYLPDHALRETPAQLAERWELEWNDGIDGSTVRPGFMKLSVNPGPLSPVSRKLIEAAAKCHLRTGLTIASHTGPAVAAFGEIEILKQHGVAPDAFIWVHAQNETDKSRYINATRTGMWVSLDGLEESNVNEYTGMLRQLKNEKCLHRILISHDAGWYEPGKAGGGNFRAYTTLFRKLVPALKADGFSDHDIQQLIRINPAEAFAIRVRKTA